MIFITILFCFALGLIVFYLLVLPFFIADAAYRDKDEKQARWIGWFINGIPFLGLLTCFISFFVYWAFYPRKEGEKGGNPFKPFDPFDDETIQYGDPFNPYEDQNKKIEP